MKNINNSILTITFNTMAVLLTEHYAMISLYRLALGKTTVPHMTLKKGGKEFDTINKDIEKLCCGKLTS